VNELINYLGGGAIGSTEEGVSESFQIGGMQAGRNEDLHIKQNFDLDFENDFEAWRKANVKEDEGSNGVNYGMIWVDVEINPSSGCGWGTNYNANCDYVNTLTNQIRARGKVPGIYTSIYEWETVMGSVGNCASAASVPLWYAHYDNWASFGDYTGIGGWSRPSIKQYRGDVSLCSVGIDESFY